MPGVAISGMGLGVFEEFADYIQRIGSVFLLLVLILVYRRFLRKEKNVLYDLAKKTLLFKYEENASILSLCHTGYLDCWCFNINNRS